MSASLFKTLENLSNDESEALAKVLEGDASASKNAQAALVFKNAAGDLRYPKVNAQDEIITSEESADIAHLDAAANVAGSDTLKDVVVITLQNDKTYKELEFAVAAFRDTDFRVVHVDDVGGVPTTNVLTGNIKTGSGKPNEVVRLKSLRFTSGGTGVQELRIEGINLQSGSGIVEMSGTLAVVEIQ